MRKPANELLHALAAEYVVGTLRGGARRRLEAIAREDRAVDEAIRTWERAMVPLAERVAPVEPPARVWRQIEARIAASTTSRGLWGRVAFWRNLGMAATGLAAVLLVALLGLQAGPREEPVWVAVLSDPGGARAVVSLSPADELHVRLVKPWGGIEGKSLELWALPREGAPRSLGVVANTGNEAVIRVGAGDARLRDATALAVSVEPPGGSPTKRPTGPVVCSGAIAPMRRA